MPVKIFIMDDNGNKINCNEAERETGIKHTKIRYYIRAKGAKTLDDARKIASDIEIYGRHYATPRKTHDTKHGALTLREIWEVHPHKDRLSIAALNVRICNHGAMNESLWDDIHVSNRAETKKHRKVCKQCMRKLEVRQFEHLEGVPGGRYVICKKCRGVTGNVGRKNKSATVIKSESCRHGDIVMSGGDRYFVNQAFKKRRCKAKVAAFRVMSDGQILRTTTINLGSNWSKVVS